VRCALFASLIRAFQTSEKTSRMLQLSQST
jgi:hypothetical protein